MAAIIGSVVNGVKTMKTMADKAIKTGRKWKPTTTKKKSIIKPKV